jgi:hypothetical protein
VFQRISWLPGGRGLTTPYTRSNRPLWTAGFRVGSAVVGACVLRLLVVFVPRTSSTPVATWFWQNEGKSAERVILGVRPSEFIMSEFQSPSRRIFIGSHSLPPLYGRLIGPSNVEVLELVSQLVDPKGETLHACVLLHIMMCLDVQGHANTFKLSEGALE